VVNSVFLVQLRKMLGADFCGSVRIKKIQRMWLEAACGALVRVAGLVELGDLGNGFD